MKTVLAILVLIAVCALSVQAQQQTNSITLAWDYNQPDGLSNYVFLIRSTNTLSAPLPWPVIASVTGATQVATSSPMTNWETRFFYVTATDSRTGPTNYVGESFPSNMAANRLIPGVDNTTIKRGP